MGRFLITGSADGLGRQLARELADDGHQVVVHGRSDERAAQAQEAVPGAAGAVAGDLASVAGTRTLADAAQALGPYDGVVHNAGVGYRERHTMTEDGVEHVFAINVLAPYVLTALVPAPQLIYLSSGLHQRGQPVVDDLGWEQRHWNPMQAYCDSKLLDVVLALAVARRWPGVRANAVEPGWIATRMGGDAAPGTLAQGVDTQMWLLTGDGAQQTGGVYYHRQAHTPHRAAARTEVQDGLIEACRQVSGASLPDSP